MKPVTNAIEVMKIQDNLRVTAEIMLTLLLDLKTKSPESFDLLSNQLSDRIDLNALDLASLTAEMWEIYK
ncbi:MAG: hypothetical protein KME22_09290 [Hassallia sp. WJT32-NPBG1]|jgi:acetolactate synthase regulatory subunit|nr:hypothetical protein [Hassallia sp. WJT32-NPBG1]